MSRRGIIIRLVRGLYLLPMRMPPGGKFAVGDYCILSKLMKSVAARYQICGPNAFNIHGFSEQIPNRTYVFNDKFSGGRVIGGLQFVFIKRDVGKLGGTQILKTGDKERVFISTKERSLIDALDEWSRFATMPQAFEWIEKSVKHDKSFAGAIVRCAVKYASQGTLRRLGYALDRTFGDYSVTCPLIKKIRSSKSFIPLVPGKPARGGIDRKWGIIRNDCK